MKKLSGEGGLVNHRLLRACSAPGRGEKNGPLRMERLTGKRLSPDNGQVQGFACGFRFSGLNFRACRA